MPRTRTVIHRVPRTPAKSRGLLLGKKLYCSVEKFTSLCEKAYPNVVKSVRDQVEMS